ncbi:MAG: hypothetical protein V4857_02535 [Pseudomonadota bacterium]
MQRDKQVLRRSGWWANSLLKRTLLTVALLFATPVLSAMVLPIDLREMVWASDTIVVAKVESVGKHWWSPFGYKYAKARVLETWKATAKLDVVEFSASPSWTCDISTAVENETVILFLRRNGEKYELVHNGRGRMPVSTSASDRLAVIWTDDVKLPSSIKTQSGPEERYDFIQAVKVSELRAAVSMYVGLAASTAARANNTQGKRTRP